MPAQPLWKFEAAYEFVSCSYHSSHPSVLVFEVLRANVRGQTINLLQPLHQALHLWQLIVEEVFRCRQFTPVEVALTFAQITSQGFLN